MNAPMSTMPNIRLFLVGLLTPMGVQNRNPIIATVCKAARDELFKRKPGAPLDHPEHAPE